MSKGRFRHLQQPCDVRFPGVSEKVATAQHHAAVCGRSEGGQRLKQRKEMEISKITTKQH